jgi:hypothetical protein
MCEWTTGDEQRPQAQLEKSVAELELPCLAERAGKFKDEARIITTNQARRNNN